MGSHTIPYTLAPHEDTHVAGGSDDIDSALAIAAAPDLTNTKIWQGNAGNRPVEVALPAAGAVLIVAETEVFNGTSPTVWTDLDLSGIVGSQATLVLLKVYSPNNYYRVVVRRNGDTDEFYPPSDAPMGYAGSGSGATIFDSVLTVTDTNGVIEWRTAAAVADTTVDVIAYIK